MKIIAAFAVGLALAGLLSAAPAQAQATRTFVSPTGNDASASCSLAAPCRTFLAAYALTNAGGEIAVLGTAGYGPLTISKAISIVNGGGFEAGIAVPSGGIGITINAGTSDFVSLRGLTIDGAGVGQTGIKFNSGTSLTVESCIIRHMTGDGIDSFSNAPTSILTVSNSIVNDNAGDGIIVQPSGNTTAMFNRIETNNNKFDGILVSGANVNQSKTVNATAFESVSSGNGSDGFHAYSGGATNGLTTFMVSHSAASNNGFGVEATYTGATLHLANSTLSGNVNGWTDTGAGGLGVVDSYGDNYIDGNTMNQTAPPSIPRK